MRRLCLVLAAALAASACEEPVVVPPKPPIVEPPATPSATPVATNADPLGDKPQLSPPKAFEPEAPAQFKLPNGATVWLFERHSLPMVSVTIALPSGSAADPKDKPGLAHITADMMDEGAGTRSAVELSSAINSLGATLSLGAQADGSTASLTVLKKNLKPAFEILSDVVVRPRFDDKEWKRVSDIWKNELKKRKDDPALVARVIAGAVAFGIDTPYGHPSNGLSAAAAKIDLASVKAFHKAHWRPDQAVLVVAGDVTKSELEALAGAALAEWKAPADKAEVVTPPPSKASDAKIVLVDRKDAPQSTIGFVREGPAASDPKAPLLDLINTALGASFTSRLNQNLREDHGYTYGARSGFTEMRGRGMFFARAAVRTDVTGKALAEMLKELDKMAASGLTADELGKVKAQDRAELVQQYETVNAVSGRLGTLALLGLPPGFDASATRARQAGTLAQVNELASAVGRSAGTIIVVGPKKDVLPQLAEIGFADPELWDAEGQPLKGAVAKAPPIKAQPTKPTKPKK